MKNIYPLCLILLFSVFSCSLKHTKDDTLSFENAKIHPVETFNHRNAWYKSAGTATIDTLNRYKGEKSLLLIPTVKDSTKQAYRYYYINPNEIEGSKLTITGKYKFEDASDATIALAIAQYTEKLIKDSILINTSTKQHEWQDFKLETDLNDKSYTCWFEIVVKGNAKLWLSACEAKIDGRPLKEFVNREFDAEKDNEFDNGSKIQLGELNPQMTENLEVLGKVWGFLKYYHPEVAKGKYNWDYELFRVLPQIANAKNKNERNKEIEKWIDKYGKIKETADYTITDKNKYSRIINLDWLEDKNLFDDALIAKLQQIKNAKRGKQNYYVIQYQMGLATTTHKERKYPNITWSDQGFRVLTLFKLWNTIEYCFPYVEMTDKPWEPLLKQFIPSFTLPQNQDTYELSILELAAYIKDSHGSVTIPDNNSRLNQGKLYKNRFKVPAQLIATQGGEIVVQSTDCSDLQRGDIIISVDSIKVNERIEELDPYIISSNRNGLIRNVLYNLLSADQPLLSIVVERGGKQRTVKITNFRATQKRSSIKSWENYDSPSNKIFYINAGVPQHHIAKIIQEGGFKGLILDMRKYPVMDLFSILYPILTPQPEVFMWFSENDKSMPGNYPFNSESKIGTENPDYFKGKVAILVNEGTQSHGEFSSMAYRKAPNSSIIGSQTAGADGNITHFYLPSNIHFGYTGLGAYYPDWGICQREGVKIDIPIRPTVQDIKDGRDVLIEKAIEYILE